MIEITKDNIIKLDEVESSKVEALVKNWDGNVHYLLFDKQLYGFSPVSCYLGAAPEEKKDYIYNNIICKNDEIFDSIIERKEVCSLYEPKGNITLSLYPIRFTEKGYEILLEKVDGCFNGILELNDDYYKTSVMFVDFGHGADNMDKDMIINKLRELLNKSKVLKNIYLIAPGI